MSFHSYLLNRKPTMKIIDCEQGTPEWWMARRGIPTASNFDRIITPRTAKLSASADDYICELIADLHRDAPPKDIEQYASHAMKNGVITEPEARRWYSLETGCDVQEVGFCVTDDGRFGCSPDGLVEGKCDCGADRTGPSAEAHDQDCGARTQGGLELKCPTLKVQVRYLVAAAGTRARREEEDITTDHSNFLLPDEYKPQVHGNLIVTGRSWWDFLSYAPGLPPLLLRIKPDHYTAALREALEWFWKRFTALKARIEEQK